MREGFKPASSNETVVEPKSLADFLVLCGAAVLLALFPVLVVLNGGSRRR